MPNLTTPIPPRLTGSAEADVAAIKKWGTALIDELTYILANLDAGNVNEASSVKAENIDTSNAKISNAQIGVLTADKLVTGSVDTAKVEVKDENGTLNISGSKISISDNNHERFKVEYSPDSGLFTFVLCNESGEPSVYISSSGNAVFSGSVISSDVYSSHIVGTDPISYALGENPALHEEIPDQIFAEIDNRKGIKIMQDKDGERLQKIGMSVSENDGTAYMILGAGNGSGMVNINGVQYSNGALKLEKSSNEASLGICGGNAWVRLYENGELWLSGEPRVLINGRDILSEIDALKNIK